MFGNAFPAGRDSSRRVFHATVCIVPPIYTELEERDRGKANQMAEKKQNIQAWASGEPWL